ncbi:MAG: hypothetical protein A9181_01120 [Dehalococcoides mccartyi]|nr:MAG: hypothetical protein A9181_01120 [Dehalococcoides mccartyi]
MFNGGKESNTFLMNLGFEIVGNTIGMTRILQAKLNKNSQLEYTSKQHDERCPQCKATIKAMLERIYGEVRPAHSLPYGVSYEDYANSPLYSALKEVYLALQRFRGNRDFIKTHSLPPVDYFIPNPGFVVEFDESQHFTACRKLALSLYPKDIPAKFNIDRWIQLCLEISAEDNSPIYRDEQRAWYDTLRDFAPIIRGLKPTVRLYSNDCQWCGLDPESAEDRAWFEKVLMSGMSNWDISTLFDPEPWVARIIIDGFWSKKPEDSVKLLNEICDIWGNDEEIKNIRAHFLMTCGGFLEFEWPHQVTRDLIGNFWNPNPKALSAILGAAEVALQKVLTKETLKRLARLTDYLTIGVDSSKTLVSTTQNYIHDPHVELVALVDTQTGQLYWTGKSYPTNAQQSGLVRVPDLETHFFSLPNLGNIMVLGCHDLTIFNNRNMDHTGSTRKTLKNSFRMLSKAKKPSIILQHPHTTHSSHTWAAAWELVRSELPSVKWFASAGSYIAEKELPPLEKTSVLIDTKQGGSIDFIVRTCF